MKKNQKGFSAVEILIVLAVLLIVGGGGYFVWSRANTNKETPDTASNTQVESEEPTSQENEQVDETASWLLYASKNNEYKIRLADGLTFLKVDDESPHLTIYTDSLTTKAGTKATVEEQQGGRDGVIGMYVNYFANGTETKGFGDKQTSFKTNTGQNVDKYLYLQETEPEGIGLDKGGKEYTYYISSDSADLTVTYGIAPDGTEDVELVEKMVKTVELK